jgi:hypothetical protein
MKIGVKTLANFLVEAKKNSWISGAKEEVEFGIRKIKPYISYFKNYDLCYRDQYVSGMLFFQGLEVVSRHLKQDDTEKWLPIWAMGYQGYFDTIKEKEEVNNVLKKALQAVPVDAPFRGPGRLELDEYLYVNSWSGDIKEFGGFERIFNLKDHVNNIVHRLDYRGKLINKLNIK